MQLCLLPAWMADWLRHESSSTFWVDTDTSTRCGCVRCLFVGLAGHPLALCRFSALPRVVILARMAVLIRLALLARPVHDAVVFVACLVG